MEAKLAMAEAVVARYHGPDVGAHAREEFVRVFSDREAPQDVAQELPGG